MRMDRWTMAVWLWVLGSEALPVGANPPDADLDNWKTPCYNCYNYATGKKTAYFAQPGGDGATASVGFTCASVIAGATADGLTPVAWQEGDAEPTCPTNSCLVALGVRPDGGDYHWYRKNDDGTWSQKHGQMPAVGEGDDGGPLDPQKAASRGEYSIFCGYLCVPQDPMPRLTGGEAWGSGPSVWPRLDIRRLTTSGAEVAKATFTTGGQIDFLRAHLPSGLAAPHPQWTFADLKYGFSLLSNGAVPGFPPYLIAHGGTVAFYSDLADPEISYFYDDQGLEAAMALMTAAVEGEP